MGIDLSLIWAVIIIFGIMMYVVMDGFDLGVGILFPFVQDTSDRDVMMNTVAPIWDGNETWLVLGGAGLFAAFPLAYSVVLSALYLPIIFMLMGLIFRGVAFEFRFKASKQRQHIWDKAFIGGSLTATFFRAWCSAHSSAACRWRARLCRRRIRLADAVLAVLRAGADRRLCTARVHLVDDAHRRRAAAAHARHRHSSGLGGVGGNRHRQPVDAADPPGYCRALVQHAEPAVLHAGPVLVLLCAFGLLRSISGTPTTRRSCSPWR